MLKTKYDEDEVYDGLQMIFNVNDSDNKISFKFPSPFMYNEIPFVYDNKLMMLNVEHPFPIIIKEESMANLTLVSLKLDDMILPIEIDPQTILKKHEDFIADAYDLAWNIITGQTKYDTDPIATTEIAKNFIKDQITFIDDEEDENFTPLESFIIQYYGTNTEMVPYHPEMRPMKVTFDYHGDYELRIGSNDTNDNYTDTIFLDISKKIMTHLNRPIPITLDTLITNLSLDGLTKFLHDIWITVQE